MPFASPRHSQQPNEVDTRGGRDVDDDDDGRRYGTGGGKLWYKKEICVGSCFLGLAVKFKLALPLPESQLSCVRNF